MYEGSGRIGDKAAQPEHAFVLHNEGDTVQATAGDAGLKFLLVAGRPIGEPIVQCAWGRCGARRRGSAAGGGAQTFSMRVVRPQCSPPA